MSTRRLIVEHNPDGYYVHLPTDWFPDQVGAPASSQSDEYVPVFVKGGRRGRRRTRQQDDAEALSIIQLIMSRLPQ